MGDCRCIARAVACGESCAERQKGAHYRANAAILRGLQLTLRARGVLISVLLLAWLTAGPAQPADDPGKTETELAAVKAEIARVTNQVSRDQVERDRLSRDLRTAELSVGAARERLEEVRRE